MDMRGDIDPAAGVGQIETGGVAPCGRGSPSRLSLPHVLGGFAATANRLDWIALGKRAAILATCQVTGVALAIINKISAPGWARLGSVAP